VIFTSLLGNTLSMALVKARKEEAIAIQVADDVFALSGVVFEPCLKNKTNLAMLSPEYIAPKKYLTDYRIHAGCLRETPEPSQAINQKAWIAVRPR